MKQSVDRTALSTGHNAFTIAMITVIFAVYRDFWPLPWFRVTAMNIGVLYAISVFKGPSEKLTRMSNHWHTGLETMNVSHISLTSLYVTCLFPLIPSMLSAVKPVHDSQCSAAAELQWHELGSAGNGGIQCYRLDWRFGTQFSITFTSILRRFSFLYH